MLGRRSASDSPPERGSSREPTPFEHPEQERLGQWLRAARTRRGVDLAEVAHDTRINHSYLEAIEAERFEELPAPVYARGFVRSDARYLGLDPARAIELMPGNLPRPADLDPLPGLRRSTYEGSALPMPALPDLPGGTMRWLGIGAAVLVVLALLFVVRSCGGGGEDDPTASPAATAAAGLGTGARNDEATGAAPREGGATPAPSTPAPTAPAAAPPAFERGRAPDLVGMQRERAQEGLRAIGLTSVVVEIATADAPVGQVIGQTPAAGAPTKDGDNITLVVSRGPPRS